MEAFINFDLNLTDQERDYIQEVLDALRIQQQRTAVIMDLTMVHRNICTLDLARMAEHVRSGEPHDLCHVVHDLCGIREHLDRERGTLERFHPRFAVNQ